MPSFYLAPALSRLRAEVDKAHPKRDRRSDGWVGDTRHAAAKSDHNPDYPDDGVVRALDIDKDGVNMARLLSVVLKHSSTNYVIWNGHIYSRAYRFRKRVYTGANKHTAHMHISIRHGKTYENSTKRWGYTAGTTAPAPAPAPKPPAVTVGGVSVKRLQAAVRAPADGQWGPGTDKHMDALRMSSGYHGGKHPFGVRFTQMVVGAKQDGAWGPNSIRAHKATTTALQTALRNAGFDPTGTGGTWGPHSEKAYRAARAKFRR